MNVSAHSPYRMTKYRPNTAKNNSFRRHDVRQLPCGEIDKKCKYYSINCPQTTDLKKFPTVLPDYTTKYGIAFLRTVIFQIPQFPAEGVNEYGHRDIVFSSEESKGKQKYYRTSLCFQCPIVPSNLTLGFYCSIYYLPQLGLPYCDVF